MHFCKFRAWRRSFCARPISSMPIKLSRQRKLANMCFAKSLCASPTLTRKKPLPLVSSTIVFWALAMSVGLSLPSLNFAKTFKLACLVASCKLKPTSAKTSFSPYPKTIGVFQTSMPQWAHSLQRAFIWLIWPLRFWGLPNRFGRAWPHADLILKMATRWASCWAFRGAPMPSSVPCWPPPLKVVSRFMVLKAGSKFETASTPRVLRAGTSSA